ncbi:hypothetical protein M431DRAFT_116725 [Trichoderma harzianum CBS 226.95]|uniref:Zn(2)-C6 fungal-type domain-containing protein n=1 Tax=Trichoderma harzianum CBS 226.95 TaxID=983964 RepID=A0A2T4A8Z0_TRIHA|nr:hypothetical protein M431DRAFT_116725 [Trichoderma harzianum CBS 226.95]PTB53527.1 hypothetical protein M431DRAFT_116725 [Trichoderma harzianum CBS 226.95]
MISPHQEAKMGRGAKACSACHWRKVKCDVQAEPPCTNCRIFGDDCVPHQRKRKGELPQTTYLPPSKRSTNNQTRITTPIPAQEQQRRSISAPSLLSPAEPNGAEAGDPPRPSNASPGSYLGRAEYVQGVAPIDEEDAKDYADEPNNAFSEVDHRYLQELGALELPTRVLGDSLISHFMERCYPWMPIVNRSEFRKTDDFEPSLLLFHSLCTAGCRVSMAPTAQEVGQAFYHRAKALYYSGHEKNPLVIVRAMCMLQWWNPSGPEHVSIDSSSFWLHMTVGLAHQIGLHREPDRKQPHASLRRRLWWTIFSRDCLISMCHGRPRAIHPEGFDVRPLTLNDFPELNLDAHLFLSYVDICGILGDLTDAIVRDMFGRANRVAIEARLLNWSRHLHEDLRIYHQAGKLASYNFKVRQLWVAYFTALVLLFPTTAHAPSAMALLATSFIVAIFEEFLNRGELPMLAPVFVFYMMTAGLVQSTSLRCPNLEVETRHELDIIDQCLAEMGKRYPSATGARRVIRAVFRAATKQDKQIGLLTFTIDGNQRQYLEQLGPELCPKWDAIHRMSKDAGETTARQRAVIKRPRLTVTGARKGIPDEGLEDVGRLVTEFDSNPVLETDNMPPSLAIDPQQEVLGTNEYFMEGMDGFGNMSSLGNWMLGTWVGGMVDMASLNAFNS